METVSSEKTKAVMIAHTLGDSLDLKTVKGFCGKHNLWITEDNCGVLDSKYTTDGVTKYTGTWQSSGTSSFYPPHHMTTGKVELFIPITCY